MNTGLLSLSGGRLFRLAVGAVLFLAGLTLLMAQGLEWLRLELLA